MVKQKKLFKQLRNQGATIKPTTNGHYMISYKTFTYTLSNGFEHKKEYHDWRVREIYRALGFFYITPK